MNCQVGVFLAYASGHGQTLIDRQLYLPRDRSEHEGRRAAARIPEHHAFATKPTIAAKLIADALYGSDSKLRRMLESRAQPYCLAVRSNHCLRFVRGGHLEQTNPETMTSEIASEAWSSHAAGEGAKGLRLYDWARIPLSSCRDGQWERWLLIRRSRRDPEARAHYFVFAPAGTDHCQMAGTAGLRWTVDECFRRAKDDLGLDHCEARSWNGWNRPMTLVMAAEAFLARLGANLRRAAAGKPNERSPNPPIAA